MSNQQEHTGVVKYFKESKNYGYIIDDITREWCFVHGDDLIDEITEGDRVLFFVRQGKKGTTAYDVRLIK